MAYLTWKMIKPAINMYSCLIGTYDFIIYRAFDNKWRAGMAKRSDSGAAYVYNWAGNSLEDAMEYVENILVPELLPLEAEILSKNALTRLPSKDNVQT